MEFSEKLQRLRAGENLTQEALADKLYVSRTAISKWESGRGYPSIESLKVIAKYFHVTIDELICADEVFSLAEQDLRASSQKTTALICGVLDCLAVLLFFLPVFGDGGTTPIASVPLTAMTQISRWLKVLFIAVVGLSVLNGFCAVVIASFDRPVWNRHRLATGLGLSILGTMLFIATRQPYAGLFFLCILIVKGFLALKSQ